MWASDPLLARHPRRWQHWYRCWRQALPAALLWAAASHAQPTGTVTEEDLARVRRDTPTVTDEDVRRVQRQYQQRALPLIASEPSTSPRIDALPKPLTQSLPDLSAIARGYADAAVADGMNAGPSLLIFISLGMPPATLARLTEQAARARATVVLRGLSGQSLRETVVQVQRLIGTQQVAVQIDPQAFDRYAIQRVPAFVLARSAERPSSCASGSCPPPTDFASASGDVSLDYALEHLRRASPGLQREAGIFLARLKR